MDKNLNLESHNTFTKITVVPLCSYIISTWWYWWITVIVQYINKERKFGTIMHQLTIKIGKSNNASQLTKQISSVLHCR